MSSIVETPVRGVILRLAAQNRAMTLCARMNYETEVLDFIDAIPPGGVLYDLGACEGRFTTYAALRGVNVWAFEPEAMNHAALLENLALNGLQPGDGVHPQALAIGAVDGEAVMKIGQPWAAGHHKVVGDAGRVDLGFEVQQEQAIRLVSLDSFIASGRGPQPEYLKVDVDGSENAFLEGARSTLASRVLRRVIIELCLSDPSYERIVCYLAEVGFTRVADHLVVAPDLFNIVFEHSSAG